MRRVAGRQRKGGGRGRTDDAPVVRPRDKGVLRVVFEGSDHLVDVGPERRLELDLVALRTLFEMPEGLPEPRAVPGDRDVAARGARQSSPRIVTGSRAQRVPADPFHDDDV